MLWQRQISGPALIHHKLYDGLMFTGYCMTLAYDGSLLDYAHCWSIVSDDTQILSRHRFNVACLLGRYETVGCISLHVPPFPPRRCM